MGWNLVSSLLLSGCVVFVSCTPSVTMDSKVPGMEVRRIVMRRQAAVVVTERKELKRWVQGGLMKNRADGDADAGTAVPISGDGYLMTADHVLAKSVGRQVFVVMLGERGKKARAARVVWRNREADLAILHIEQATPDYYEWSSPNEVIPVGTYLIHGGISTGKRSAAGVLNTPLPAQYGYGKLYDTLKVDIVFAAGDSGGALVNGEGKLVGINSAVEYMVPLETPFFVDSEGIRPNVRKVEEILKQDRERRKKGEP